MNTSFLQSSTRPLFIDFDLYTDGDAEFKKELIMPMIDNMRELQQSLAVAHQQRDAQIFKKVCHKVKPTLSMLNDPDLLNSIEELNEYIGSPEKQDKISVFHKLCEAIIKSLERESK